MNQKINIFGIDIMALTAKEAMKTTMQYLDEETVNTIEIVTLAMLMKEKDNEAWKEQVQKFDLLLPGEKALFEASEECDRDLLRDLENKTFLRMLFKYMQKNKKRIFLLTEKKEELEEMKELLKGYAHGLEIAGQAILPADSGLEENVINEINGVEPDCILSGLPSPRGERFVIASRALLNARLWIGGVTAIPKSTIQKPMGRIGQFILKKIFCYQVEKQKTDEVDDR